MRKSLINDQVNRATQLRKIGDFDGAIRILEDVLRVDPFNSDAVLLNALSYMNTGRLEIAIRHLKSLIIFSPDHYAPAFAYLGFCLLKNCDYKKAIPPLEQAISPYPTPDLYLWIGEALMRNDRYVEAINYLKQLRPESTSDPKRLYSFLFLCIKRLWIDKFTRFLGEKNYVSIITDSLREELGVGSIISFGDSHSKILEDVPGIQVFQTGHPTAYRLLDTDKEDGALSLILRVLSRYSPEEVAVMLNYGGIDIRFHIYKHIIDSRMTFHDAASVVASKYFEAAKLVHNLGFKVMVNGPFGSGTGIATIGEVRERNLIARLIDHKLSSLCSESSILYSSLVDIVTKANGNTAVNFFGAIDENHLDKAPELQFSIIAGFLTQIRGSVYEQKIHELASSVSRFSRDVAPSKLFIAYRENVISGIGQLVQGKATVLEGDMTGCTEVIIWVENHYAIQEVLLTYPDKGNPSISESSIKCVVRDTYWKMQCEPCIARNSGDPSKDIALFDIATIKHDYCWGVYIHLTGDLSFLESSSLSIKALYSC